MIYLKEVDWLSNEYMSDRRKIFPLHIEFKDVTLLVGPNGCGKTSLLKDIAASRRYALWKSKHQDENDCFWGVTGKGAILNGVDDLACSIADFTEVFSDAGFSGNALQLKKYWMSNGETRNCLVDALIDALDGMRSEGLKCSPVMMIDELDHGLDWKSQKRFAKILKSGTDITQFIISTHNVVLMSQFEEVFDMESKSWVKSGDYIRKLIGRKI